MTIEQLGSIGEFVAAIAVLISLIYVAYQVRQNTGELRQAAFRDVYQAYSNNRRLLFSDPETSQLIISTRHAKVGELSEEEVLKLDAFYAEWIWVTVQLWGVRQSGSLEFSEESWNATLNAFFDDFDSEVFREYWERRQAVFPEWFAGELNEFMKGRAT